MKLFSSSSGIIFSKTCAHCGVQLIMHESALCLSCIQKMPRSNNYDKPNNTAEARIAGRFPFERVATFALYTKGGILQPLIHKLKYKNKKEIGIDLGYTFGCEISESQFISPINLIVPVPLHIKKERKRGYNQAKMIALGLSKSTGIPISTDNLLRTVHNPTQTKLSAKQRWENVAGIFSVKNPSEFENKHLLLVDDIITTGSTLEACAHAIEHCSNVKISIAVIGMAD